MMGIEVKRVCVAAGIPAERVDVCSDEYACPVPADLAGPFAQSLSDFFEQFRPKLEDLNAAGNDAQFNCGSDVLLAAALAGLSWLFSTNAQDPRKLAIGIAALPSRGHFVAVAVHLNAADSPYLQAYECVPYITRRDGPIVEFTPINDITRTEWGICRPCVFV